MGSGIEQSYGLCRGIFREIAKIQVWLDESGAAQRMREVALRRLEQLLARGQTRGEICRESRTEDLGLRCGESCQRDDPPLALREHVGIAA